MTIPTDPRDPRRGEVPDGYFPDEKARKAAGTATIIGAIAGLIAIVALILILVEMSNDYAPLNCDPATDYVCRPETSTATTTTQVPSTSMSPTEVPVPSTETSMSPTEVPVPTSSPSEIVTTTVKP